MSAMMSSRLIVSLHSLEVMTSILALHSRVLNGAKDPVRQIKRPAIRFYLTRNLISGYELSFPRGGLRDGQVVLLDGQASLPEHDV